MQFNDPHEALRYHVSGAIERGEKQPIVEVSAKERCVSCNWLKPLWLLDRVTVGAETFYVCGVCSNNLSGPGKHQAVAEDDRALCVVLEHLAGVSGEDWMLADEAYGYAGQFDRFILLEDSQGFVEVREFANAAAAEREMRDWEDDGFGASYSDGWITSQPNGYSVSLDGKHIGTFPRLNRALAAMALAQRDAGYYPNTFLVGEHGPSVRRVEVRYLEEVKS